MSHRTPKVPPPRVIRHAPIDAKKIALARSFRRAPTPAEAIAWRLLRDRRLLGLKFRRQQVIDGFVVDFYCPSLRVVVELDGGVHEDPSHRDYDAIRSEILQRLGIVVLRIENEQVDEQSLCGLLAPRMARRTRR
jgi:very-short-patch-repair endonuclease